MDNKKEKYKYALEKGKEWLETLKEYYNKKFAFATEELRDIILYILPELKVEPKFEVGDWIIFNENNNNAYQVERIGDYRYYLRHYLGGTLLVPFNSGAIRLWTIQDAKNGDVLSYKDGQWIFIYKEKTIDDKSFSYHVLYSTIYRDLTINDVAFTLLFDAIVPATKEQHDLLFQKMKEAGYEWDAKKKELKKIEKNSIEPDDLIEESYKQQADDLMDTVTEKSVWSKEDEKMITEIISNIAVWKEEYYYSENTYKSYEKEINWIEKK